VLGIAGELGRGVGDGRAHREGLRSVSRRASGRAVTGRGRDRRHLRGGDRARGADATRALKHRPMKAVTT
jgi:hypothetical protein